MHWWWTRSPEKRHLDMIFISCIFRVHRPLLSQRVRSTLREALIKSVTFRNYPGKRRQLHWKGLEISFALSSSARWIFIRVTKNGGHGLEFIAFQKCPKLPSGMMSLETYGGRFWVSLFLERSKNHLGMKFGSQFPHSDKWETISLRKMMKKE